MNLRKSEPILSVNFLFYRIQSANFSLEEVDEVTSTLEVAIYSAAGHLGAKKKPLELLTDLEKTIELQLRIILNKIEPGSKNTAESKLKELKKAENMEKDKK